MKGTIYTTEEYVKIWAEYDNAKPLILELKDDKAIFKIALLIKNILGEVNLFEAYTPYGYGGPVLIEGNNDPKFPFDRFLKELESRNIIDAFVRFSPFLDNQKYFPPQYIELNRYTISRHLEKTTPEAILKTFSKGTKWSLRKSMFSDITVSIINGKEADEEEVNNFFKLYSHNMNRVDAEEYYFFNKQCLINHFIYLRDNIDLFVAKLDNKWIAASIFLLDDEIIHYHLSASDYNYYKLYPVDRILFEAILYYGNIRKKFLHLGGGMSLNSNDSLFSFKKKFGDIMNEYYIGKLIISENAYREVQANNGIESSKYFLINDSLNRKK